MFSFFRRNKSKIPGFSRAKRFRGPSFQSRIRETRALYQTQYYTRSTNRSPVAVLIKRFFVTLAVILIIVSAFFVLVISDYFLVKKVEVEGNQKLSAESINVWLKETKNPRILGVIPRNHLFFLDANRTAGIILEHSPLLLSVTSLQRVWPSTLKITIKERAPVAIWKTGNDYFYLGSDSVVTEQVVPQYATSTDSYYRIEDMSSQSVETGENLGLKKTLDFIEKINGQWQKKIGTGIEEYKIPARASQDIFAVSKTGWTVFFNTQADPGYQLANLQLILEREIGNDSQQKLSYIDLRLPNIAYYCLKDEPCSSLNTGETGTKK